VNASRPRRHLARGLAAVGAAALAVTAIVATSTSASAAVTKVSTTTDTRCTFLTYKTPTDWYFPSGTPTGLVWIQHGFSESKNDLEALAQHLAGQGALVMATTLPTADMFGCTVENVGNNTGYLNNVADVFGTKDNPNDKLGKSFTNAKNAAGRSSLTMPTKMVFIGHSVGGEAVSYIANRLRTNHPSAWSQLKGVVLEDPVPSFIGSNLANGLNGLKSSTQVPIYLTASPDSSCNNDGAGIDTAIGILNNRPFHGALVTTGRHTDVLGSSASGLATLGCGTPDAPDTAAVFGLTAGWVGGFFAGSVDPSYLPGGAFYQGQVSAGIIATLP
jgi:hypothetical protein